MIWPRIKSPKFYLSFTILVSFILVKYPDKIGIVNTYQYGTSKYGAVGRQAWGYSIVSRDKIHITGAKME